MTELRAHIRRGTHVILIGCAMYALVVLALSSVIYGRFEVGGLDVHAIGRMTDVVLLMLIPLLILSLVAELIRGWRQAHREISTDDSNVGPPSNKDTESPNSGKGD